MTFLKRLLEFAPLDVPALASGPDLPDAFLAVGALAREYADLVRALADQTAVVALDGLDRAAQASVIARSRGFVGDSGAEALVAVMLGVPAVVLGGIDSVLDETDRKLVASFLSRPPFGRLDAVGPAGAAGDAAERILRLLDERSASLVGVT